MALARAQEALGLRCVYCGCSPTRTTDHRTGLFIEHIVPDSRGGDNGIENTALTCGQCNTRKGDRTPLEMIFQDAGAWPVGVRRRHWRYRPTVRFGLFSPAPCGGRYTVAQADGA